MPRDRAGTVHWCGHLTFVPASHRHDMLEVNLVQQGCSTYFIDGRRYELGPGHALFLFPTQEHALLDTTIDHRAWVLHAHSVFVRDICTTPSTEPLLRSNPPEHFASALLPTRARHLTRLFRALLDDIEDDAQFNAGLAFALLTCWAEHLRARAVVPEAHRDPLVERVVRLLRKEKRLALSELARACGVSRSVLTRSFKRQTGLSVVAYHNRLRVERFLALYAERGGITLLDAALEAGFGSYAQFHRVFCSVMGHAPSKLARRR